MKAYPLLVGEGYATPRVQENPAGRVCLAAEEDVERALALAHGFRRKFARMPLHARLGALENALRLIEERAEELAELIHRENRKPLALARNEVTRAQVTLKTTLAEAWTWREEHFRLDQTPLGAGRWAVVRRVPYGVVLAITPFNYPLNLPLHKVAPALAVGAPVILKPAPATPVTAVVLGEILREAGFPPGAIQVVPTPNELAEKMVRDERVAVLSFTGSAQVGWHLKRITAAKVVILELGGNAGVIVEEDADVEHAANRIVTGAFGYSGQVCISVQRILVNEKVAEPFRKALLRALERVDRESLLCPLISEAAVQKVEAFLQEALSRGGRVVYGDPARLRGVPDPLVLEGVPHDALLWREEVFGPVALIETYTNFDEALDRVNDSRYGLQAGLFTRDIRKILRAFEVLEVGGLMVNDVPTYRADIMPYGGAKASGLLREGPRYAMEALTEPRVMVVAGLSDGG